MKQLAVASLWWAIALVAALMLGACGFDTDSPEAESAERDALVDLDAGTYRGIGIGSTEEQMKAVFGDKDPALLTESAAPVGHEDSPGPHAFNPFPGGAKPRWFRYDTVTFFVADGEVVALMIVDPTTITTTGIRMGSELDAVKSGAGLEGVRCGTVNEMTEYEPYAACSGKTVSGLDVWLGGDPLANITIGTVPLEGV
ncbi:MAG TPA: hypothetical protein VG479_05400 [Gaiellaceae bacterium]|nr:hypothetical protein [Gaiellaceae bacterium]